MGQAFWAGLPLQVRATVPVWQPSAVSSEGLQVGQGRAVHGWLLTLYMRSILRTTASSRSASILLQCPRLAYAHKRFACVAPSQTASP